MKRALIIATFCSALLVFAGVCKQIAHMAAAPRTLIVTDNFDGVANHPGCFDGCTLREAVLESQSGDTIEFASPRFDSPQTISLTQGELQINDKTLTIKGRAAHLLTISGAQLSRIFYVSQSTVTLSGMTLIHGKSERGIGTADGRGGAIQVVFGSLTLIDSIISGCTAIQGGAIYMAGVNLNLIRSTLYNNSSSKEGSAIYSRDGTVGLNNATVSGNSSPDANGAAIFNYGGRNLFLINATITKNSANGGNSPGGITNGDPRFPGLTFPAFLSIRSSIVAENPNVNSSNIIGPINSQAYNLIGGDPKLYPLGDYFADARMLTHAIKCGSQAINAGDPNTTETTDQRGRERVIGGRADIGSYELKNLVFNSNSTGVGSLSFAFGHTPNNTSACFDPVYFSTPRTLALPATLAVPPFTGVNVAVTGPGAHLVTVDAGGDKPIFNISNRESTLSLSGIRLIRGRADLGGAIYNNGTLNATGISVESSTATSNGGGLYTAAGATTNLSSSTIAGNSAILGGGIFNAGYTAIYNSTVANNTATGNGGGIYAGGNYTGGNTATVDTSNSTISGNSSGGAGGGIYVNKTGTIAFYNLNNTLIATNSASGGGPDVSGEIISYGYNLIGNASGSTWSASSPVTAGNIINPAGGAKLNPLANTGGATKTFGLQTGSPAIDAGDPSSSLNVDQRGAPRPFGTRIDIGAHELRTATVMTAATIGAGSFREAVDYPFNDYINFDSNFFNANSPRTITVSGDVVINRPVTINGPGANLLTLDANNSGRNFLIGSGTVNLSGLRLYRGNGQGFLGGGIFIGGGATLNASNIIVESGTTTSSGGGIANLGTLNLTGSTVKGSSAGTGGALFTAQGATSTVTATAIFGNTATSVGGGVYNEGASTFNNSTIANNTATDNNPATDNKAGGIYVAAANNSVVNTTNVTISGNHSESYGGGVYVESNPNASGVSFNLRNTILAGNTATLSCPDASAPIRMYSFGYNLIGKHGATFCSAFDAGSPTLIGNIVGTSLQPVVDPRVAPLGNYGGASSTMALLQNSPAIDTGDPANSFATDQRGELRPFGPRADIGAFETSDAQQGGNSLIVTTLSDGDNGACGVAHCTLREAIKYADAGATVIFQNGLTGVITLSQGELPINQSLTIQGPGASVITVSGNNQSRVFNVIGGTIQLAGLTITGGRVSNDNGGGIRNAATLTISNCTLFGNTTNGTGGAVFNAASSSLTVFQSTLTGNSSTQSTGGAVANSGTLTISNSTLSANSAIQNAGGISNSGTLNLNNSIVAGNTAGANPNINGAINSGSFNLTSGDPRLGSLASNGGTTQTMALLPGSPAINAGDPNFNPANAPFDQRGAGFDRIKFSRIDIGAFELQTNTSQNAGSLLVNTLNDGDDGSCSLGDCTLREAIKYANAGATITFQTGLAGTIVLTQGELLVDRNLTITGPGADVITVSGNNQSRVLHLTGGLVAVSGLTINGGRVVNENGGGIIVGENSTLTISTSTLSGNSSTQGNGGAISSAGVLTILSCTLSGNSAGTGGGGISNDGILTVSNSTLSVNSASNGGGLYNRSGALTVSKTTLSGNSATGGAGGIANEATLNLTNTIVADNGSDISGTVTSGDYNLIQNAGGATLSGSHNVTGQDAKLSALASNGGPTQTVALLQGSPAFHAGNPAYLTGANDFDQRGAGFPRVRFGIIDIGAFESDLDAPTQGNPIVTTLTDGDNGSCGIGDCTLREAIKYATAGATIIFQAGLNGTITLSQGELLIDKNLTIIGPGASVVSVSGNGQSRVFNVTAGTVRIEGLTITGGRVSNDNGGGIRNGTGVTLTIANCTLTGNSTPQGSGGRSLNTGGGAANFGTLNFVSSTATGNTADTGGGFSNFSNAGLFIDDSTVSDNRALSGGGIQNLNFALVVIGKSTISGNMAGTVGPTGATGGGVYMARNSGMRIVSSTIAGNIAGFGGAIFNDIESVLDIRSSTISANTGGSEGGGIYSASATFVITRNRQELTNTICAGNSGGDIRGTGATWGITGGSGFNLTSGDPKLAPLGNYGGTTKTMALLPDSPAINAGYDAVVEQIFDQTTDQRGVARKIGAHVDIGAFEQNVTFDPTSLPNPTLGQLYNQRLAAVRETSVAGAATQNDPSPFTFSLLQVSGQNLPPIASGGSMLNSYGQLIGTPTVPGTYTFTIKAVAADGLAGAQQYSVQINTPPNPFDVNDQIIDEDTTTGPVSFSIGDAETPDSLTVSGSSSNQNLIPNANIAFSGTGASRAIAITPAPNQSGTAIITVTVADASGGATQDTFGITVNAVNDAPSFTKGADQTVDEDSGAKIVNGWATNIISGPADESGQTFSFTVSTDNSDLFSVQPTIDPSGQLAYTLGDNTSGTANVTVTLSDTGSNLEPNSNTSVAQTFTITVRSINDVPTFEILGSLPTVEEDAGAQTVDSFATNISAGAANEDDQPLTFNLTATSTTGNLAFSNGPAIDPATGNLTYTPAADTSGAVTFAVTLSDHGGNTPPDSNTSAAQTFTITVTAVNDPPSFTKGADPTVNEDAGPQTIAGWASSLSPGPNESGQTMTFNITPVGSTGNISFASGPVINTMTGTLTYTPAANTNGTATFNAVVTDSGSDVSPNVNQSAPVSFTITINPVNDEPSFTKGPDQNFPVGAGAQTVGNWATNINAGPSNENLETLTFNVTNNNNALFTVAGQPAVSATGTLTYEPAPGASGVATVSVTLMDNGGTTNGGDDTSPTQTFTIKVGLPAVSVQEAGVPEPASPNTVDMTFTVALNAPAGGAVSVNFQTNDGSATAGICGNPGADYVTTNGTVNFTAGEQVKTINVPICSDGVADDGETFTVTLSSPSGASVVDGTATGTITANTAGTLLISELRTSGPGGAGDDFVEIYNNTNSPITVPAGGYGLFKMGSDCDATPVLIGTIPAGRVIPARGHYLFTGLAYSLANYGGTNAATGDNLNEVPAQPLADIATDANIGLFSTTDVTQISSANRLDAVGFGTNVGGACNLLREGSTLPAIAGNATLEHSYFRKLCDWLQGQGCTVAGVPKDTNNNSADFWLADTAGSAATGRLGAPGPENLASPIRRDNAGI
ncbi:MAG TPA: choice-of-anchor Q domain-containing protein, partial [Pyrinomonadaceae bacterium]